MNNYASGELTPGRWYKDNTGNEYRFIGEASSDNGVGLFNSGEGVVKKSYNDFEPNVKETKMFKWFKDGGETKQVIKLEPITTKRNKQGFRFYSTNDGNTIYAEKNGKIHNVSEDSLNVLGEVPLRRSRFEFVGIISDEDTKNLYPLHYEYKTMAKVKDKFQMAEGGEVEIGDYVKIKENYGGGSGTVEDIMNNFVIVKTKEGKKSFHKSDLIPYSSASEAAYDLGDEGDPDYEDFEDDYAEGGMTFKKEKFVSTPIKEGDLFRLIPAQPGFYNDRRIVKIDGNKTTIVAIESSVPYMYDYNRQIGSPYEVSTSSVQKMVDENAKIKFEKEQNQKKLAFQLSKKIGANKAKGGNLLNFNVRNELYKTLDNLAKAESNVENSSVGAGPNSLSFRASMSGQAIKILTNGVHRAGSYGVDIPYILQVQIGGNLPSEKSRVLRQVLKDLLSKYTFESPIGKSRVDETGGTNWSSVMLTAPTNMESYSTFPAMDMFANIKSMKYGGYMAKGGEIELLKVGQVLHLRRLPIYYRSGDVGKQREVYKKVVEVISKESRIDEDDPNENNKLKTFYYFKADDKKNYNATFWGKDLIGIYSDNARYEALDNPKMADGGQIVRLKKGLPYMASLSNLYDKDLKVDDITEFDFASGRKKFYHITHDGDKYEVNEDFVDDKSKMAEGGIINFDEIRSKLDKYGYNFSSPYGTNRIDIKGYGKGGNKYFNAKKAKAISVVNDLKHIGIDAKYKLSGDGFYDIYISEDGQYAKGGELDKITFSIDSEELDETLHNTFESQLEYNDKNGDVLYTLPKRQFDRLIDLADSKGFDVDYENSEDSVIIVYNDYANGGFVEKTDEELKGMNDDELFEYLDAKAAYMKQYTRPLSAYKAKNFAANATAVQYQKEGTAKLDDNFPNIEKINKQAEQDYQQGLKKIVEKRNKMADGGEIKLKETYKYIGDESLFTPLRNGRNTTSLKKGDVVKVTKIGADGKEDAIVANFDGDAILLSKEKLQDSNSFEKTMSKGGETKFADKVNSIKKKLLANKKVPKSVQKDYGKTYNKAEAKESAQRIVGSMLKKKMAKGGINSGKTPAPLKDRIYGSKKNKAGSASSKTSAQKIELNETILETLKNKAKEYNDKHSKKVSTNALKAVMRRGMGAYSSSHRPTITGGAPNSRQAWGYARVNKFLKKKSGQKVKAAYVQDDDLM